jgi:hypothetical protein
MFMVAIYFWRQFFHPQLENTQGNINREKNAHNALSGIRTHDSTIRASEDSSSLRLRTTVIGIYVCYYFNLINNVAVLLVPSDTAEYFSQAVL